MDSMGAGQNLRPQTTMITADLTEDGRADIIDY